MSLLSFFTEELALDLGTVNTVMMYKCQCVLNEPSIIAVDKDTLHMVAVGTEAKQMQENGDDNLLIASPLREEKIADLHYVEMMLKKFTRMAVNRIHRLYPPLKMAVCVPTNITEEAEKVTRDMLQRCGVQKVQFIYRPIAAAIGIGLDILSPNCYFVINIGEETCEVAVVTLGAIITSRCSPSSELEKTIMEILENLQPEVAADIYESGIHLVGDGAMLQGLDKRMSDLTHLPVHIAPNPQTITALGASMAQKNGLDKMMFLLK